MKIFILFNLLFLIGSASFVCCEQKPNSVDVIDSTSNFVPSYKLYGLDVGPYVVDGQNPEWGYTVSEQQIRNLLLTLAPYTKWVRTYGSTNGLEHVCRIADSLGLQVAMGAWLGSDTAANAEQINRLIELGQSGCVDIAIVGSETLYRGDIDATQLIAYMQQVKLALPNTPVTTADVFTALIQHPDVIAASDVVMANIYPFWEGISIDSAVSVLAEQYALIKSASGSKPVWISETGWPSEGNPNQSAVPNLSNAARYLLEFDHWAIQNDVPYLYFESFNEPWKSEMGYGAHWGIFQDDDKTLKPGMEQVFSQ